MVVKDIDITHTEEDNFRWGLTVPALPRQAIIGKHTSGRILSTLFYEDELHSWTIEWWTGVWFQKPMVSNLATVGARVKPPSGCLDVNC